VSLRIRDQLDGFSTCLPTVRLLLVKIFPVLGGSSNRSGQNYRKYGSDNRLNKIGRVGNSGNVGLSGTSSHGSKVLPDKHGVVGKTLFTVHRAQSDADEISLVEKNSTNFSSASV
jgi:hypothetical protein